MLVRHQRESRSAQLGPPRERRDLGLRSERSQKPRAENQGTPSTLAQGWRQGERHAGVPKEPGTKNHPAARTDPDPEAGPSKASQSAAATSDSPCLLFTAPISRQTRFASARLPPPAAPEQSSPSLAEIWTPLQARSPGVAACAGREETKSGLDPFGICAYPRLRTKRRLQGEQESSAWSFCSPKSGLLSRSGGAGKRAPDHCSSVPIDRGCGPLSQVRLQRSIKWSREQETAPGWMYRKQFYLSYLWSAFLIETQGG